MGDRLLELDEGGGTNFLIVILIAAVLMAEGMEVNVAKQQAEKAVILVQGSLILAQGLNDVKISKRIIGDLATELLLS
jgi:TetR/AcrR family transcriptional repressor of lmrAB and yxaGH operons